MKECILNTGVTGGRWELSFHKKSAELAVVVL